MAFCVWNVKHNPTRKYARAGTRDKNSSLKIMFLEVIEKELLNWQIFND